MNNKLENHQQKEEYLKKILSESKGIIDKAEILNESNNIRLSEITNKLSQKGIDSNNIKNEIINNINKCNIELDSIYDSISFKMLEYYNKTEPKICAEYVELKNKFNNHGFEMKENIEEKIEILKVKASIVEFALEQSKSVRDTAIGKEENLKARKLEIENKIISKGIDPKNIEFEIDSRKNQINELQNEIYESLTKIINTFKSQDVISQEIFEEWNIMKSTIFDNMEADE